MHGHLEPLPSPYGCRVFRIVGFTGFGAAGIFASNCHEAPASVPNSERCDQYKFQRCREEHEWVHGAFIVDHVMPRF